MLGAIIGDIVGSRYEWRNVKRKDFDLFSSFKNYTDDTVMTVAVASACLPYLQEKNIRTFQERLITEMRRLGRLYPNLYGSLFTNWLKSDSPQPYYSYGNGAAMRVSPVAYVVDTLEEAQRLAKASAEVTHNHPEGIKGAQAVSSAIFLSLHGQGKAQIKAYIEQEYYSLGFHLDDIREQYSFNETCQGSVP